MERKYTMKEFEEMFKKAQIKTIEKLDMKMKEADTEGKMNGIGSFTFSLQNMLCMNVLYKELFRKENE